MAWDDNGQFATGPAAATFIWNWDGKLRSATKGSDSISDLTNNANYPDNPDRLTEPEFYYSQFAQKPINFDNRALLVLSFDLFLKISVNQ